jgi:hypothetical protein
MYWSIFHTLLHHPFCECDCLTKCFTTDNTPSGCSCNCEKKQWQDPLLITVFFVKMIYCGSRRRRLRHDVYSTPVIVCLVSARGVKVIKGISNWDRSVDSKPVDMLLSRDTDGWNLLGTVDSNGKRRNRPVWSVYASLLSEGCEFDTKWRYDV